MSRTNPQGLNAGDVVRWTADLLAGELDAERRERLLVALASDHAAREAYASAIELHALLEASSATALSPDASEDAQQPDAAAQAGSPQAGDACSMAVAELLGFVDEITLGLSARDAAAAVAPPPEPPRRSAVLWGAVVVLAASLATVLALPSVLRRAAVDESSVVGVLTHEKGATWGPGQAPKSPSRLRAGRRLDLDSGVAEVTLTSGVVVVLRGPAEIDLVSPMKIRARRGVVRARVGEDAKGFVIETPTTEVVDLGTEFGVDVDDDSGATDVVVFDGSIDLRYVSRGDSAPAQRSGVRSQKHGLGLLHSGEALRVAADGATSRIVSIHSNAYPSAASESPLYTHPPLIRGVSDNLRDPDANQYYQIVHAGMREDCRAYVDRHHQWNGVTRAGMPEALRGADYVMTFNADKLQADLAIRVDLAAPARLFVLFDKRLPPPKWLADRFRNTDDEVGVDENLRTPTPPFPSIPRIDSAVGPGESIDTVYSVWAMDVPKRGQVELGALPRQELRASMYGIAAQPLPRGDVVETRDNRPSPSELPGAGRRSSLRVHYATHAESLAEIVSSTRNHRSP
jgi:ferric-dicitrate binding protein FerR (iron transport regulator)